MQGPGRSRSERAVRRQRPPRKRSLPTLGSWNREETISERRATRAVVFCNPSKATRWPSTLGGGHSGLSWEGPGQRKTRPQGRRPGRRPRFWETQFPQLSRRGEAGPGSGRDPAQPWAVGGKRQVCPRRCRACRVPGAGCEGPSDPVPLTASPPPRPPLPGTHTLPCWAWHSALPACLSGKAPSASLTHLPSLHATECPAAHSVGVTPWGSPPARLPRAGPQPV